MKPPGSPSPTPLNPLPEPPAVSPAMVLAQRRYWRFNLCLIAVLMLAGCAVSFGIPLWSPGLSNVRFQGWRLPFYFGAQGAILIYLLLVGCYICLMQRADRRLQMALDAERAAQGDNRAPGTAKRGRS